MLSPAATASAALLGVTPLVSPAFQRLAESRLATSHPAAVVGEVGAAEILPSRATSHSAAVVGEVGAAEILPSRSGATIIERFDAPAEISAPVMEPAAAVLVSELSSTGVARPASSSLRVVLFPPAPTTPTDGGEAARGVSPSLRPMSGSDAISQYRVPSVSPLETPENQSASSNTKPESTSPTFSPGTSRGVSASPMSEQAGSSDQKAESSNQKAGALRDQSIVPLPVVADAARVAATFAPLSLPAGS